MEEPEVRPSTPDETAAEEELLEDTTHEEGQASAAHTPTEPAEEAASEPPDPLDSQAAGSPPQAGSEQPRPSGADPPAEDGEGAAAPEGTAGRSEASEHELEDRVEGEGEASAEHFGVAEEGREAGEEEEADRRGVSGGGGPEEGAELTLGPSSLRPRDEYGEQREPPSYAVRHVRQPGLPDVTAVTLEASQRDLQRLEQGTAAEDLARSPQLARVQEALRRQLQGTKQRLEEELRARRNALKAAVREREDVGVELYGFQQTLARLQLGLQRAQEAAVVEAEERAAADAALQELRARAEAEEKLTAAERAKMENFRTDLETLTATLRQVDAYNEQLKSDIATTRRATYAAEEGVQKRERAKRAQDLRVDDLYKQVKTQQAALELATRQLEAQRGQTAYARQTLATAVEEMDAVRAEQRKRGAQWQAALGTLQKRDDALRDAEAAFTAEAEREAALVATAKALRKEIADAEAAAEAAAGVCRRVEGRGALVRAATAKLETRTRALQAKVEEAGAALAEGEAALAAAVERQRRLREDRAALEREWAACSAAMQAQEARILEELTEQTQAERSAQRAAHETVRMRAQVKEGGFIITTLQNELARIEMDLHGVTAHNSELAGALSAAGAFSCARTTLTTL